MARKNTGARLIGFAIVLVVFAYVFHSINWHEIRYILREANWGFTFLAMFVTGVSYGCAADSFAVACRLFGINVQRRELVIIGFVSTVLNNVMATGGIAGHSVRTLAMKRHNANVSQALAASIFHSYFNNLIFFAFFPIGLFYLLLSHPLGIHGTIITFVALLIFTILLCLSTGFVFSQRLRYPLLRLIGSIYRKLFHKDATKTLATFHDAQTEGVTTAIRNPRMLAALFFYITIDWAASVTALGLCFDALGRPVSTGVLLTGFALGITVGALSMIPGGLGVQDGSMVGVFTLLGVPLETTVLAVLLFRTIYYILPFAISFIFYRRLLTS